MSIASVHPAVSSSDALFSFCLQSFPASETFPVSQLFTSDDQNTGVSASASVLPMIIHGWLPLRLTDLIPLLYNGISGIFSSITIRRHPFFSTLSSLRSSSHHSKWPLGRPYIALTIWTSVGRVVSLLFNPLSRLVITFLPRSKCLWFHCCSHHPLWF